MKLRSPAGLAGLVLALLLAAPAAAVAGPTVTVRVEGANSTLLERTRVTLPDTPPPVAGCNAHTAAAAIDVATGGNWDRDMFTETILGETHAFASSDYWAEWLDRGSGIKRGAGVCADVLNQGDEVVMLADVSPPPDYAPTVFPLDLEGVPAQARVGDAITITVVEYRSKTGGIGEGDRTPVAGATVRVGAASATSGPDGRATLVLGERGAMKVKATRPGNAASGAEDVVVGDVASAPTTPTTPDKTAPTASISGIRNGQRFTRRRAPRELRGTVNSDPSGLWAVKIRLTRRHRGTCWYFSGSKERFLKRTCGKQYAFKVGEQSEWSYLLPARLPRGRYVLDTYAIDNAFNRGKESRVVFRVR
jgi:hypothetical protein